MSISFFYYKKVLLLSQNFRYIHIKLTESENHRNFLKLVGIQKCNIYLKLETPNIDKEKQPRKT